MDRHGPFHDGKSKTRSAFGACARFIDPVEALKYLVKMLGRNAWTAIAHFNQNESVNRFDQNVDSAAGRGILYRIVDQIDERLTQDEPVGPHR